MKGGGSIHLEGWAFDANANLPCGAIDVAVDGKPLGRIRYGIPRPDVAAFYKDTQHVSTGFAGTISTKGLRPGETSGSRPVYRTLDESRVPR